MRLQISQNVVYTSVIDELTSHITASRFILILTPHSTVHVSISASDDEESVKNELSDNLATGLAECVSHFSCTLSTQLHHHQSLQKLTTALTTTSTLPTHS
jgi:hypothetical protein